MLSADAACSVLATDPSDWLVSLRLGVELLFLLRAAEPLLLLVLVLLVVVVVGVLVGRLNLSGS